MNELKNLHCEDALIDIKQYPDYFFNTIFSDFPYALGSKWKIDKETGHYIPIGETKEFIGRWDVNSPNWWDEYFGECFRVLKYNGYLIFFSIDRVQDFFVYYGRRNGFEVCQSLYYYFLQNFPKSTSASIKIDNRLGEKREIIGKNRSIQFLEKGVKEKKEYSQSDGLLGKFGHGVDITKSSSELAKQYDNYRYSVIPFKQVLETIIVLRKPNKTGSILNDIFALEKGDTEISPGVINIEEGRVPIEESDKEIILKKANKTDTKNKMFNTLDKITVKEKFDNLPLNKGRYPSQLFLDSGSAEIIDKQSGILKSGKIEVHHKSNALYKSYGGGFNEIQTERGFGDQGGASRINHICDYEKEDFDLLIYSSKVANFERNLGLDDIDGTKKYSQGNYSQSPTCKDCDKTINGTNDHSDCSGGIYYKDMGEKSIVQNSHPCLKPISLLQKITKLFQLPKETNQIWYVPFFGSGSEITGLLANNVPIENIYGCENDKEFFNIAQKRIMYWYELFKQGYTIKSIKDNPDKIKKENDKERHKLF